MPRKLLATVAAMCLLGVAALIAVVDQGGDESASHPRSDAGTSAVGARAAAGTPARFAYLAAQRSNACGLEAEEIKERGHGALRGSCCSPMDKHSYREQVLALRRYRAVREIPPDPYDVSVRLAQRLLRFDATISLSPGQGTTYRRAMRISDQKGPCCCPCWRWNAFRGLSKFLIARRRWSASRVAHLVDALEGCGGPAEHDHS